MQLFERTKVKAVNFAYVNIKLNNITPSEYHDQRSGAPVWDFEMLPYELNVISHNRIVGRFEAVMKFRIVGAPAPPQPEQVNLAPEISLTTQEETKEISANQVLEESKEPTDQLQQ